MNRGTQDKVIEILFDDSEGVRSAALYALGTFRGASGVIDANKQGGRCSGLMFQLEERFHFRMEVAVATGATLVIKDDASPLCRKKLLVVISCSIEYLVCIKHPSSNLIFFQRPEIPGEWHRFPIIGRRTNATY